jgi:hypothetical protein
MTGAIRADRNNDNYLMGGPENAGAPVLTSPPPHLCATHERHISSLQNSYPIFYGSNKVLLNGMLLFTITIRNISLSFNLQSNFMSLLFIIKDRCKNYN